MAEGDIRINGRPYRMACEDGQEPHLNALAQNLDQRVGELVGQVGQIGDARLLVMAALMIADEAHELRVELDERQDGTAPSVPVAAAPVQPAPPPEAPSAPASAVHGPDVEELDRLAGAIEDLADRLEQVAAELDAT